MLSGVNASAIIISNTETDTVTDTTSTEIHTETDTGTNTFTDIAAVTTGTVSSTTDVCEPSERDLRRKAAATTECGYDVTSPAD